MNRLTIALYKDESSHHHQTAVSQIDLQSHGENSFSHTTESSKKKYSSSTIVHHHPQQQKYNRKTTRVYNQQQPKHHNKLNSSIKSAEQCRSLFNLLPSFRRQDSITKTNDCNSAIHTSSIYTTGDDSGYMSQSVLNRTSSYRSCHSVDEIEKSTMSTSPPVTQIVENQKIYSKQNDSIENILHGHTKMNPANLRVLVRKNFEPFLQSQKQIRIRKDSYVTALYSRGPWLCIKTANGEISYIPRMICSLYSNRLRNSYTRNNPNSLNHCSLSSTPSTRTSSLTSTISSRGRMHLTTDESSDNDVLDLTTVSTDKTQQHNHQRQTNYCPTTSLSSIYGDIRSKQSHRQKIATISKRQLLNENGYDMMIGNCDINRHISRSSSLLNKSQSPKTSVLSNGENFINRNQQDIDNVERCKNTCSFSNKQTNTHRSAIASSLFSLNCTTVPVTENTQQQYLVKNYDKRCETAGAQEIEQKKSNLELINAQQHPSQLPIQPRDTDSSSTQDSGFSEPYFLVDRSNCQQFKHNNLPQSSPQNIINNYDLQQQQQHTTLYDASSKNSKPIGSLNIVPCTFPSSNKIDHNNSYRLRRSKRHTLTDTVSLNNHSDKSTVVNKRHSFGTFQLKDNVKSSIDGNGERQYTRKSSVDSVLKPHESEMTHLRTVNNKYLQVAPRLEIYSNQHRLPVKNDASTLTQSLNRLEDMINNYPQDGQKSVHRNNRSNVCLTMPKSHDQIPTKIILNHHRQQATIEKVIAISKHRQSKPTATTLLSSSYQFGSSFSAFRPVKPKQNKRASSEGHSPVDHQLSLSSSLSATSSTSSSLALLKNTDDASAIINKKSSLILKRDPKRRLSCDVSLNNDGNNNNSSSLNKSLIDNISLTQSTYDNIILDKNNKSSSTTFGPRPFIRTMSDICDQFSELNIDEIEKDSLNPIPTYRTKKSDQTQLLLKMMIMNKNRISQEKTSHVQQKNDLIKILKDYRNPRSSFSVKRGDYVCLLKQVSKACFLVRKHNGQIGFLPKALMDIETTTIDAFLQMHGYRETVI
ncbi:unnamed protein product [Didymodactylos carnosus]|uniref:SH3 domain-containing protein n=1 Tax=Didymodactylos carnosus TaxID=1234261 RepID=A0A813V890_9BILA|nr:unnamed protein product [Didymodactylos carnosus]CAF0894902.1 unnamed protein product [Didymodactylos carnosus]CAF3626972.1 unnamed protein product [Didymodactylos carnosus]CAF3676557.1 unnamed protein product [Didymodactylos carnosus]